MTIEEAKKEYKKEVEYWHLIGKDIDAFYESCIYFIKKAIKNKQKSAKVSSSYKLNDEKFKDFQKGVQEKLSGYNLRWYETNTIEDDYNYDGAYLGKVQVVYTEVEISGWGD